MGQQIFAKEKKAFAKSSLVRTSVYKANLVAALIRGKKINYASEQLQFSKKKVAREMYKVLQSAIANAYNNHSLDIDRLVVDRVELARGPYIKRFAARARGRGTRIMKPLTRFTIVLLETESN
jgi:large subunit ribosomal protein L22